MKIIRSVDLKYIPASHEDSKDPGVWKKVLFKKDELVYGRVQMINWAKLPVGRAFAKHYHEDMEEVFIILSGRSEFTIDNEMEIVQKGDAVIVPIGKIHTMTNVGKTDVVYICLGISTGKGGKTIVV